MVGGLACRPASEKVLERVKSRLPGGNERMVMRRCRCGDAMRA